MSRPIKVLWIIIASFFAIGLVLAGAGFAIGATGQAYLARDGLHIGAGTLETIEITELESEPFTSVEISLVEAEVEMVPAERNGYVLTYTGYATPVAEVRGGKLTISEGNSWGIRLWNFWDAAQTRAKLTVYVSGRTSLEEVNLNIVSGQTSLDGKNIDIENLSCQTMSGDLSLQNLDLEQLNIAVVSGHVKLDNVHVQEADLDFASGVLSCTDGEFDYLTLRLASGKASVEGRIISQLDLEMVSGDADFDLTGNADDYRVDVEKVSGEVRVDGKAINGIREAVGTARGRIQIDVASGAVNLNFKS